MNQKRTFKFLLTPGELRKVLIKLKTNLALELFLLGLDKF